MARFSYIWWPGKPTEELYHCYGNVETWECSSASDCASECAFVCASASTTQSLILHPTAADTVNDDVGYLHIPLDPQSLSPQPPRLITTIFFIPLDQIVLFKIP